MSKETVIYYSQTGVTSRLAHELSGRLHADLYEVKAAVPYPVDEDALVARWLEEIKNDSVAAYSAPDIHLDDYDTVFLCFPVWGAIYPPPLGGWMADHRMKGKRVIVCVTFGSGGTDTATAGIAKALPGNDVVQGFGIRDILIDGLPEELHRFLTERGFIKGHIDPLPPFGPELPLTDDENLIFTAACGDYPYPLGTPVSAASRRLDRQTGYRFRCLMPDGERTVESTVYVRRPDDGTPVFTEIIRQ